MSLRGGKALLLRKRSGAGSRASALGTQHGAGAKTPPRQPPGTAALLFGAIVFLQAGFGPAFYKGKLTARVVGRDGACTLSSGTEVWAAANPVCYNF